MENSLTLSKYWLEKIVIALDLCPFARIPHELGLVRMVECTEKEEEGQLGFFIEELDLLNESDTSTLATTLIVYPYGSPYFESFNDFVGDLEFLLKEAQLDHVFQLVAFHPCFVFEQTDFNDLGNLVNRSPYPVLHILRSEDMARAVKNPKDGEAISFSNDKKLRALSRESIDQLFYYLKK